MFRLRVGGQRPDTRARRVPVGDDRHQGHQQRAKNADSRGSIRKREHPPTKHRREQSENPVVNLQFGMMVFCLLMVLIVALYNRVNPWLSLVFFLISLTNLGVMIRQHRLLPPMKRSRPWSSAV